MAAPGQPGQPGQPGDQKPEYQHFIPQFILKNFAHKYTGSKGSKGGKKNNKNKKKKAKDQDTLHFGEPVVNNVDLRAVPFVIEEAKVKRVLGRYDMYQDKAQQGPHQREIESLLGKLESQVGIIFRKIIKAFEDKKPDLWLDRVEMNTVRKFIFIQKYRNTTFYRRFNHDSPDEYVANDAEPLRAYMDSTNTKRPIDVWFQGLKAIIELDLTKEGWQEELHNRMFHYDARWFIANFQFMYMAICTPSNQDAEFILTDNSHSIFEGPNFFVEDPFTGETHEDAWTNFHEFCPVSPKLMIVLRSFLLPVPEEDEDPEIASFREELRKSCVDDAYGAPKPSLLADLPITKARNNYSEIVNGRVQLLPGEFGDGSLHHKFCLRFFPIEMEHVNMINHFMFDNAYLDSSIVFGTYEAFFRTLEWYMTVPCKYGKVITGDSLEERRRLMVNLAALAKSLGSDKEPVWRDVEGSPLTQSQKMFLLALLSTPDTRDKTNPIPQVSELSELCSCDGCSGEDIAEDMEQAFLMRTLRIKIDVWSKGLPETVREQARVWLTDAYLRTHTRRALFYIKGIRLTLSTGTSDDVDQGKDAEDIIGRAMHCKMASEKLNRLMYNTMRHDVERLQDPSFSHSVWTLPPMNNEGIRMLGLIKQTVLLRPGLLKDCGIPEIERLALSSSVKLRKLDLSRAFPHVFLKDEEKIEILTRVLVKKKFKEVLAGKVETGLLDQLHSVFFDLTYPTPPIKFSI